jgi:4-aminobutyrate aminotransferase-like enzyme/aminoglycoside phosphotransferase (APT) family kinase protein
MVGIEGLIALKTDPPQLTPADAELLAREHYGIAARAQALPGERDRNFHLSAADGQEFVLKVVDPAADEATLDCQSSVLRYLAEQAPSLPVPRIVETCDGSALARGLIGGVWHYVRVVPFMPGTLAAQRPADARSLQAVGQILARLDGALAGYFHAALGQRIVWDVRQAPALLKYADYLDSSTSRRLVRLALNGLTAQMRAVRGLRAQAIHGDCHPRNLLLNAAGDCVGILDFGDMIHAPLVLEPAVAMAEFLAEGIAGYELIPEILAGYTTVQPLLSADVELLYELITSRLATNLLIHAWRSRHDPAGAREVADSVALATESLETLTTVGPELCRAEWHRAAGTSPGADQATRTFAPAVEHEESETELLARRRRLLGAHAELFYTRPLHLVRGTGVWVYTAAGERFLDVYNNVPHVGHAHPAVVRAIHAQASRIASNTRYLDETVLEYAERLTAGLPAGLDSCLFVNSGSEANDVAWRMACSHTGRGGALVMTNAYHGITEAVTALSPALQSTRPAHVECLDAPPGAEEVAARAGAALGAMASRDVQRALAALTARRFALAAFIVDSAFTSNGIFDPPADWMTPIATAVQAAGGLIIGDEVQYGLGRSGSHFWGFARRGYVPDIVTLGKPVGNGFPLGVVITRRAILEAFQARTGFFSTFGGNPVAAAAGLAVLDVLEREQLMANALSTGRHFRQRLIDLAQLYSCLGEVRGHGLLLGVEVIEASGFPAPRHAKAIINGLRERGVLVGSEGPAGNVLKLRPPMCFGREHADRVIAALSAVLADSASGGAP